MRFRITPSANVEIDIVLVDGSGDEIGRGHWTGGIENSLSMFQDVVVRDGYQSLGDYFIQFADGEPVHRAKESHMVPGGHHGDPVLVFEKI